MVLGMIGIGRMGSDMTRRLLAAGHACVCFDLDPHATHDGAAAGATVARSLFEPISKLAPPRAVWMMVPAAMVEMTLGELAPLLAAKDTVIDGGDSYCHDDIRRADELAERGIHYVDVGTSGGVWGFERGYCQMIGGEASVVLLSAMRLQFGGHEEKST